MENNNNNADVFEIKNISDEQLREIALSQSSVDWAKIFEINEFHKLKLERIKLLKQLQYINQDLIFYKKEYFLKNNEFYINPNKNHLKKMIAIAEVDANLTRSKSLYRETVIEITENKYRLKQIKDTLSITLNLKL